MNFFAELKRRNVIRVGLAYLVLSWLLLQVGDVLFDALRLDDSALTIMLVLLALGFIPVVIFAWVYELTPEGVKRESDVERGHSITAQTGYKLNITIVFLLVASLALFAWDRFIAPDAAGPPADAAADTELAMTGERSIAVLPFADMSSQGDQAYFADGIAEELLNVLAQIDGLKVAARTSSFKFRGGEHDIVEIGNALNVATVLEGSVRRAGNQVRITAQLIDVAGGYHLWSESYDRELDNILAVQDEIAAAIADALKLELQLQPDAGARSADSGEAYDLYLRGRELAREPGKAGLQRAIQFYEQALALDPDLAPAYGAIASAWIWLEDYGGVPADEAFDRAEPAARRALELDPGRADALTAMGFLEDRKYSNAAAARDYFERALAANPTFTEAATLYADSLTDFGDYMHALKVRRDAVDRDPLSGFLKSRLASLLANMGRIDEAEVLLDELFAANPEDTYGYEELANLRFNQGRLAEAVKAYEFVHENRPGDPYSAANLAASYALMGDEASAKAWIGEARARGPGNRWELEARRAMARWSGDWVTVFRLGQLYLAKGGATWQGLASLGQSDWEAARISFKRTLSRMNYREGEPATGNVLETLAGLALAEKRLGLESWTGHARAAREYTEQVLQQTVNIGSWPSENANYVLAQVAAIEGDVERVFKHIEAASDDSDLAHQFFAVDPFFAELRDEPRLLAIAAQTRKRAQAERAKLAGGQPEPSPGPSP